MIDFSISYNSIILVIYIILIKKKRGTVTNLGDFSTNQFSIPKS